jgi:hypothetical protein
VSGKIFEKTGKGKKRSRKAEPEGEAELWSEGNNKYSEPERAGIMQA